MITPLLANYLDETDAFPSPPDKERIIYIYTSYYQDDSIFDVPIKKIRELPNIFEKIQTIKKILSGYKIRRYKQLQLYERNKSWRKNILYTN